jgi:hypothetical protein
VIAAAEVMHAHWFHEGKECLHPAGCWPTDDIPQAEAIVTAVAPLIAAAALRDVRDDLPEEDWPVIRALLAIRADALAPVSKEDQ